MKKNTLLYKIKKGFSGYLFILPAMLFFLVFVLYPIMKGIIYSFYDYTSTNYRFIGFGNFVSLFRDESFIKSLVNTFIFVAGSVPLVVIFSLFVSVIVYKKSESIRSFFRAAFYLPAVSAIVAISLIWQWVYNPMFGLLNYITGLFGLAPRNWLGSTTTALPALIIVLFTLCVGQPIVLYIASLGNIPQSYIEAANIDGASSMQIFTRIIWPLLLPTSLYVIIYTTIGSFQTFAIVHLLTGGGPFYGTSTILFQLYQSSFLNLNYGIASAMGIVLAVIIIFISIIQYKLLSTNVEY